MMRNYVEERKSVPLTRAKGVSEARSQVEKESTKLSGVQTYKDLVSNIYVAGFCFPKCEQINLL